MRLGRILVDADSCPVKQEILKIAEQASCPVVFVSCPSALPAQPLENCEWIVVGTRPQEADLRLLSELQPFDLVVCTDRWLAATVLQKEGLVLTPFGRLLTYRSLMADNRLPDARMKVLRKYVFKHGHAPFCDESRDRFCRALSQLLFPPEDEHLWLSSRSDGIRFVLRARLVRANEPGRESLLAWGATQKASS